MKSRIRSSLRFSLHLTVRSVCHVGIHYLAVGFLLSPPPFLVPDSRSPWSFKVESGSCGVGKVVSGWSIKLLVVDLTLDQTTTLIRVEMHRRWTSGIRDQATGD
ncbi:uncharacterized protein LOC120073652 [Benincasa hispida]|uniref:uncharacterized protein LOC120073652 n=1 Tax=Benincasa hispida TaxID=102211 RepID=UPI0019009E45|nr:uncharacterized protein LOC120073652 [Benincasa hispida]